MAKIHTYAPGELLSAQRINTDLNLDVPNGATTQTAFNDLAIASGEAPYFTLSTAHRTTRVSRQGLVVVFGGAVRIGTTGRLGSFRHLFTIPAQYLPGHVVLFTAWIDNGGFAVCQINPDGTCHFLANAGSSSPAGSAFHWNTAWVVPG